MSAPEFSAKRDARGELIVCTYEGGTGTARVFSAGVLEACQRAEAQARAKAAKRASA